MLIANTGQSLVVMNLRTGEQVQLPPGQMTPVLDSKIPFIDDSFVLISLFNAGVLVAYTDAGAAYPGFPTTANPADSKRIPPVDADYAAAVVGAAGSYSVIGILRNSLQAGLNRGSAYIPSGETMVDECLLVGSNTIIEAAPSARLMMSGATKHTMLRTGNAEFSSSAPAIPGVSIYCADEVGDSSTGRMRYTHATTSLAWLAPGESQYGAEVDISSVTNNTNVAIFALPGAAAGKQIYVYVAPATRSGVITRTVRIEPVTGARAMTWTRASNVRTVTETAHGRRVGDFVICFGPAGDVSHGYIIARTADTFTMSDTGTDQGSAQAGRVYGVRNIRCRFNGAVWDYNSAGSGTTALMSNLHAMIFLAVSDLFVSDVQINNATKYAVLVTGYKTAVFEDVSVYRNSTASTSENSDVIHPLGPGQNFVANRTRAQGGDNVIGVGCADYYDYVFNCPQYGSLSLIGGRVTDTWCEDTDEHPVRFYNANGSNVIRGWTIDTVEGTYSTSADACVAIIRDSMNLGAGDGMVDLGETNITDLTIIRPNAVRVDGSSSFAVRFSGAGTRRGIKIRQLTARAATLNHRASVWIDDGSSAGDLDVEVLPGTFSGSIVAATGSATCDQIKVACTGILAGNNELGGGEPPAVVTLFSSTTVVKAIDISGLMLDDVSTTGTKLRGIRNVGSIVQLNLDNVQIEDGDALVRYETTATRGNRISARNARVGAAYPFVFDGGMPADMDLTGVIQTSAGNALVTNNTANAQAVRLHVERCKAGNRFIRNSQGNHQYNLTGIGNATGGGGVLVIDAGTPVWRLDGDFDLPIDGALLDSTVANHRAGARFFNTNAAFGAGVGAYVRGATAWVRVAA